MSNKYMNHRAWGHGRGLITLTLSVCVGVLAGCETDSFLNPSVVGRWENTPVTLPVLDRLDVIEGKDETSMAVTGVRPEDLIPDMREYIIGSGDLLTVSVFELVTPGIESIQTRRVDETGVARLPIIGPVRAKGQSPSQLEAEIINILERKGILHDAVVSVILQESRQNTFSVVGSPLTGGTAIGTYVIPKPDFRILSALAMARGVPDRTKKLRVIRQTPLTAEVAGNVVESGIPTQNESAPPVPRDPTQLIDELLEGIDIEPANGIGQAPDRPKAPTPIESGLESDQTAGQWVNVGGKWVKVGTEAVGAQQVANEETDALSQMMTQRIIEIPYDRLMAGDMRYNIIIRPGDVIRVPGQQAGFVYIMGEINRPGAYTVPGENELTLQRLVASAGNLSQLAIPERVDLVRRVGDNQQATIRLNLRAIFEGSEPDLFLKRDDLINVGTNFIATPLAIFRNGLRSTYGFGFVIDRNFDRAVFGNN